MIEIRKTFSPDGMLRLDYLTGVAFSRESGAHRFVISGPEAFTGTVTASFMRADGQCVIVTGSLDEDGRAVVTADEDCYLVPGRMLITVYVTDGSVKTCVYAGLATVYDDRGSGEAPGGETAQTIEELIQEFYDALPPNYNADSLAIEEWRALFARNISEMEGIAEEQDEAIDAQAERISDLQERMVTVSDIVEGSGLHMVLNGPNLIGHQPGEEAYIDRDPDSVAVTSTLTVPAETAAQAAEPLTLTITDPAITEDYDIWEFGSSDPDVVDGLDLAVLSCTAGSATLTLQARPGAHESAVTLTVTLAATVTGRMLYGDTTRHYACNHPYIKSLVKPVNGQEQDQISEQVALLTGDNVIRDLDGREYSAAVAFTVANAPTNGYNNCDQLIFGYGTDGGTTTINGETVTYPPSGVFDLEDGQQYTLSCFARITSGEHARVMMGYGYDSRGQVSRWTEENQIYIEVSNQEWRRLRWTFTYHNSVSVNGTAYAMRKRVGIGVCRAYNGTLQLAGFRLTAGGLYSPNDVDTLSQRMTALEARVSALEAMTLENAGG